MFGSWAEAIRTHKLPQRDLRMFAKIILTVFVLIFLTINTVSAETSSRDRDREARKKAFLSRTLIQNPSQIVVTRTPSPPEVPTPRAVAEAGAVSADEKCGVHPYLGHYCFKPAKNGEWLLCTDKWGGCITQEIKQDPR